MRYAFLLWSGLLAGLLQTTSLSAQHLTVAQADSLRLRLRLRTDQSEAPYLVLKYL